MKTKKNLPREERDKNSGVKVYLRYSSLAFQMIVIILAGVFSGRWLDQKLDLSFPVFLLALTLIALVISFYLLFKEILK